LGLEPSVSLVVYGNMRSVPLGSCDPASLRRGAQSDHDSLEALAGLALRVGHLCSALSYTIYYFCTSTPCRRQLRKRLQPPPPVEPLPQPSPDNFGDARSNSLGRQHGIAVSGVGRARRRSRHLLVRAQTAAAHRGDRKAARVKGTTSGYKTPRCPMHASAPVRGSRITAGRGRFLLLAAGFPLRRPRARPSCNPRPGSATTPQNFATARDVPAFCQNDRCRTAQDQSRRGHQSPWQQSLHP
jgi:hypothetical protein